MISSVYQYYLSTYGNREVSKYDSHKKSELKDVYYSMLKVNRKAPLYKFENLSHVQKYAIDIKEMARVFQNVAASLTDTDGSITAFSRKKAQSSDEKVVEAEYLGTEETEGFEIFIKSLAKKQVNVGNYVHSEEKTIPEGSYSFDLSVGKYTYEFSFDVPEGKKTLEVQKQVQSLINRSSIGVTAEIRENAMGETALSISSNAMGIVNQENGSKNFDIRTNDKSESGNLVEMLGIDHIEVWPENAVFEVDGEEHTAISNEIRTNNFHIKMKGESLDNELVRVSLKPDFDAMIENVSGLIDAYNEMLDMAVSHEEDGKGADRLMKDIRRLAAYYKDGLDSAGFMVSEDGHIHMEESILIQAEQEGTLAEGLEHLNRFKNALVKKTKDMSVDPMKYVNKKMISYPNPVRNHISPYVSSLYSGMMFNGYV